MNPKTSIILHQLELHLHLGWSESERLLRQPVWVDVHLHFSKPPEACHSDELDETYNYEIISHLIKDKITPRSFRLIEYVAYEIYKLIKSSLPQSMRVSVGITKKPPISHLAKASFWYGDE